ncbi:MAG: hypothetical protein RQ760_11215, partial [Sedimentisphaerales bacterium]|nr:hypothetical protein [Sedimentisphaerales bacterium]
MNNKHVLIKNNLFCHTYIIRPISLPGLLCTILLLLAVTLGASCRKNNSPPISPNEPNTSQEQATAESHVSQELPKTEPNASEQIITAETSLFDGKSLGQWEITDFGGQGKVYVKDGAIYMEMGNDMTGIN